MQILRSIILLAFILGLIWVIPGSIWGFISMGKAKNSTSTEENAKFKKNVKLGFLWIYLVFGSLIFYVLLNFVLTLLGIKTTSIPSGM